MFLFSHIFIIRFYYLLLLSIICFQCIDPDADPQKDMNQITPINKDMLSNSNIDQGIELPDQNRELTVDQNSTSDKDMDIATLPSVAEISIASYNVQNLFDLIDDEYHLEGNYTPSSVWNQSHYQKKISAIAKVAQSINADILTLQEVESEAVLLDLKEEIARLGIDYTYHRVSPSWDPRGIALAVLSKFPFKRAIGRPIDYQFECSNGEFLDGYSKEARPIDEINFWGRDGDYHLTLLINHWKSRAADPYPCQVAEHQERGGEQINSLLRTWLNEDSRRSVVVLGDFNTTEYSKALSESLDADLNLARLLEDYQLYNTWGELNVGDTGVANTADNSSYFYNQRWQRLDHIFVTRGMTRGSSDWQLERFEVISPDFLLRNQRPYSWDFNAQSGYSDHLPIKITLVTQL
jgi:predicted extracellular nuclease